MTSPQRLIGTHRHDVDAIEGLTASRFRGPPGQAGGGFSAAAVVFPPGSTKPGGASPTGQALTRVNDTNVTVALGGTPASALLQAVSLTLGWTGQLGLARGGTNADLSGTGGAGQYLKQGSAGAAVTVGTIPASDIASGQALTKTNDTNVTLTLGGTPTTALLKATSLTLGWTGLLAEARGGTGVSSVASLGANPSASIGLSVINGSAATFMRSDAAPPIDQSIAPVWTGIHSFRVLALGSATQNQVKLINTTASTVSVQRQVSPALLWHGTGWDGAASQAVEWQAYIQGLTGTDFLLGSSYAGAAFTNRLTISDVQTSGQVLKSNGTRFAAANVAASEITGGAALTKTDDTNVTLTLGGTPASALLAATSLTLGWTGTLAVSRGGIGVGTLASNGVLYGNGTGAVQALAVNATATRKFLSQVSSGAPAWNQVTSGDVTTTARFGAHRAVASGAQSMANNTFVTVICDAEDFDPGNNYDNTTGIFTAPVAGIYQFDAAVGMTFTTGAPVFPAGTAILLTFTKNGTEVARVQRIDAIVASTVAGINMGVAGSCLLSLAASDTVAVGVFQNSGNAQTGVNPATAALVTFAGHLLSV